MEQGPEVVLIKDFEMLFDPRYQIDVLKLFCDLSRQRRIAVLWCGTFRDNRLEFAEPGFADFQSYNTDQYTTLLRSVREDTVMKYSELTSFNPIESIIQRRLQMIRIRKPGSLKAMLCLMIWQIN